MFALNFKSVLNNREVKFLVLSRLKFFLFRSMLNSREAKLKGFNK